jgi:hypothetical protein
MRRTAGSMVLGLNACGYLLTQFAVRRCGVRGAAVAEAEYAGLAVRDASMAAADIPGGLPRGRLGDLLRRHRTPSRSTHPFRGCKPGAAG